MLLYAISNLISCQNSQVKEKEEKKAEEKIRIKKAVSEMVVKSGSQLSLLRSEKPTLEDALIKLTGEK